MISIVGGATAATSLGGLNDIEELPRRNVVKEPRGALLTRFRQRLVKGRHFWPQQCGAVGRRGAMRMQLNDNPVRAPGNVNPNPFPERKPIRRRRVGSRNLPILQPWQHTSFSRAPIQPQRTRDHENAWMRLAPTSNVAIHLRAPLPHPGITPVMDSIDAPGLGRVGGRWKCQVCITPGAPQNREFSINATPIPILTCIT